jgi:hypothetical protein
MESSLWNCWYLNEEPCLSAVSIQGHKFNGHIEICEAAAITSSSESPVIVNDLNL